MLIADEPGLRPDRAAEADGDDRHDSTECLLGLERQRLRRERQCGAEEDADPNCDCYSCPDERQFRPIVGLDQVGDQDADNKRSL